MPGQPDLNKDGVARAFDKTPDVPTYLFVRGDERTPDKSRPIPPGVPEAFGGELAVAALKFTPNDFAASLPGAVAEARRIAKANADAAQAEVKRASDAVAIAKKRRDDLAAGLQPKEAELKPFLRDTFTKKNDDLWKVLSGKWAWENGKLVCKSPSTFATVSAKANHPAALMGRIKYKTTGGGVKSVGFSYDVTGNNFQAVYINAGSDPAVRPFIRKNGADNYTTEIVPIMAKVNDEITLDFAVRGKLLNIWVNGQLKQVYTLPMERAPGTFTVWAARRDGRVLRDRADRASRVGTAGDEAGRRAPLAARRKVEVDERGRGEVAEGCREVQALAISRLDLAQAAIATVNSTADIP